MTFDFCVIGAGIVGLATALELMRQRPGCSLVLLEKEDAVGRHQTGHNSGVVHAGIYYQPGSLKAEYCKRGAAAMKSFAAEHSIPLEVCGKLIVATNDTELHRMERLLDRANENRIEVERLSAGELSSLEPQVSGRGALLVHSSAIIDYKAVSRKLAGLIGAMHGEIRLNTAVTAIREHGDHVEIDTPSGLVRARKVVACAGLQSDRIARLAGMKLDHRIVPFRGIYYVLDESLSAIVKHLVYPVPDPEMPFLGVHLTRMIDGRVTVGPNASVSASREGYSNFSFNLGDMASMVTYGGFWKSIALNWKAATLEARNSLFKSSYLRECQKYCPSLVLEDLKPYPSGIRAQAVTKDGTLVQDFLFLASPRMLHVGNAPSPAATSAFPIAEEISRRILERP